MLAMMLSHCAHGIDVISCDSKQQCVKRKETQWEHHLAGWLSSSTGRLLQLSTRPSFGPTYRKLEGSVRSANAEHKGQTHSHSGALQDGELHSARWSLLRELQRSGMVAAMWVSFGWQLGGFEGAHYRQ